MTLALAHPARHLFFHALGCVVPRRLSSFIALGEPVDNSETGFVLRGVLSGERKGAIEHLPMAAVASIAHPFVTRGENFHGGWGQVFNGFGLVLVCFAKIVNASISDFGLRSLGVSARRSSVV
jgi:hypothetical protein